MCVVPPIVGGLQHGVEPRQLTDAEITRNNRLAKLMEDLVGSKPDTSVILAELGLVSALEVLKRMLVVTDYVDLRPENTIADYEKLDRKLNYPDFKVYLSNGELADIEAKNLGYSPKDYYDPAKGETWFWAYDPGNLAQKCHKNWTQGAKRVILLSDKTTCTDKAIWWVGQRERATVIDIGKGQVTESSNLLECRNWAAVNLQNVFLRWVRS